MGRIDRRTFIRTTLAVGAAAALPASLCRAGANESIRVGFISCGNRAVGLMRSFSVIDGVRIADPSCVNKTYPGFFDDLGAVSGGLS